MAKNVFLLTLLAVIILQISCTRKYAELSLGIDKINLDTLSVGKQRDVVVILKNEGNDTLTIFDFDSSCECTLPALKKNTSIAPFGYLPVVFAINAYADSRNA